MSWKRCLDKMYLTSKVSVSIGSSGKLECMPAESGSRCISILRKKERLGEDLLSVVKVSAQAASLSGA